MKNLASALSAVTLFAACNNAGAIAVEIPTNLELYPSDPINQADQGPCVIGDPSCDGSISEGFTLLPVTQGQTGTYENIYSPTYTVESLLDALMGMSMFTIGIDVNESNGANVGPHELETFVMSVNGTQTYAYQGPTALDPLNNPGNGFSDWEIGTFDLAGLALTDTVQFGLDMNNVSGGRDQFFLLKLEGTDPIDPIDPVDPVDPVDPMEPNDPPKSVDAPATLATAGLALLVFGGVRRRKDAKVLSH